MGDDLKTRWVKALRSGRYRQTTYVLSSEGEPESNCCLGVLCRVARVPRTQWTRGAALSGYDWGIALRRSVGMDVAAESKLIEMNDEEGNSFSEIADYIEANL